VKLGGQPALSGVSRGLMRILLRRSGGWRRLDPRDYTDEDELQTLLKESPEIIPRNPPDLAHIVYCREFPVGSYAIDLIGVGSDGSLSLVECKLAKSHEAKRTVVGQVLEYAAGVWRMELAEFEAAFAARAGSSPIDGFRAARIEGWDEATYRNRLADNLAHGRFRILIAVDRISPELRGIIEYVNSQPGDLRLVALELPYFADGEVQVLVPETYGDELGPAPDTGPPPTVEEHLARHPEARVLHEKLAGVFRDYYTTPNQIAYRGQVGGRRISIVQLYLPERRVYFPGSPEPAIDEAGGKLKELLRGAEQISLRTTPTSIEWPDEGGNRMHALLALLDNSLLALFREQ
jgi:hypothetical protein